MTLKYDVLRGVREIAEFRGEKLSEAGERTDRETGFRFTRNSCQRGRWMI